MIVVVRCIFQQVKYSTSKFKVETVYDTFSKEVFFFLMNIG